MEVQSIQLPTLSEQQSTSGPTNVSTTHNFLSMPVDTPLDSSFAQYTEGAGSCQQHNNSILLDASYLNGDANSTLNLNLLDIPPEMFDAFLQADPISPTMNAGFDIY